MRNNTVTTADGTQMVLMEDCSSAILIVINQLRLRCMMVDTDELPDIEVNKKELVENLVSKLFPGREEFVLGGNKFFDSQIIASRLQGNQIMTWLEEVNRRSKPKLLYRASRDGWKGQSFHFRSDDYDHTLVVVKTREGYIFGGYSDQSWGGMLPEYKSSSSCFLFSLKCYADLLPTKMKVKSGKEENAIYAYYCHGPIFGSGYDICIGVDNDMKKGYTYPHKTYETPSEVSDSKTFLTGKSGSHSEQCFSIAEVEVFEV